MFNRLIIQIMLIFWYIVYSSYFKLPIFPKNKKFMVETINIMLIS